MSKQPFEKFALRQSRTRKSDRGAGAPTYLVELTRFGARIRMAHAKPDGTIADPFQMTQAPLLLT